jgi:hypothetical protein
VRSVRERIIWSNNGTKIAYCHKWLVVYKPASVKEDKSDE